MPSRSEMPGRKRHGIDLVRVIYTLRIMGVLLAAICVLASPSAEPRGVLYWTLLAYFALGWPHLAHYWASRSARPLRAELLNLWVDSLHAGFWVAAVQVSFVPTVALLTATSLGNIMNGGARFLLLGFTGHFVGLLLGVAVWGWHLQPDSSLWTQLGAVPLLMVYPLLMGRLMHRQTKQIKQSRRELRYLSEHDALSGVHNRRYFEQQLHQVFNQFLRHPRSLSLLICDVDDFKHINDRHGHAAGDEVIRQVAGALAHCARAGDVVARLGGDEFVVLLSDTQAKEAMQYVQRVREQLEVALQASSPPLKVGLSFGAAMACPRMRNHEHWLEQADAALYRSKSSNRGGLSHAAESSAGALVGSAAGG